MESRGPHETLEWCEQMVQRGLRGHRDHDQRGYRNAGRVSRAEVLAVGDSVTYGLGVPRDQAWPQQLARRTGRSVYNAGIGGWGAAQYPCAVDELVHELRPRTVLVGLYMGNDVYEAWSHGRRMRHPLAQGLLEPDDVGLAPADAQAMDRRARGVARSAPQVVHEGATYHLDPGMRLALQDLDTPAVAAGLRATVRALTRARDIALEAAAEFSVIVIPTRERAVGQHVTANDEHRQQIAAEARLLLELGRALDRASVRWHDTTPALAALLAHQLWRPDGPDGHPTAPGHRVIALAVHRALGERQAATPDTYYPFA